MDLVGAAKRVRIYVNEGDVVHHKPAHLAILELLRANGASGATALRAIEGFGGSGEVHTTRVVDADWKLPIVIEWIDSAERVRRLLPLVKPLVVRGLITVDDTDVALFTPVPVRDVPSTLSAADVMVRDFPAVGPDVPLRDLLDSLLVARIDDAVCVVEAGKPLGIITRSDLVARGGSPSRPDLLANHDPAELGRLSSSSLLAGEVMTASPVTVLASTSLDEVAALMSRRQLKRLPVVDDRGRQVGLIRRHDVLRTVGERFDAEAGATPSLALRADARVDRVLRTDVPIVHPETPLAVVMQGVIATRLDCAIVVDAGRHPVGIVTGAELLERVTPSLRPSALRSLILRLPFTHPDPQARATEQHAMARTAADLMSAGLRTLTVDATLADAIDATVAAPHRLAAVVDEQERLVGVVDHADILRGLVETSLHG